MTKRHLITSALPYANGPLHIGHIAGAYLPADIYVRYLRMKDADVAFICGSDEHGAAITLRAKKEGGSPQEIVDKYHGINKKAFADFGIDFDIYHRTSSPLHHEMAQEFFTTLNEKGAFTKKSSEQFYDEDFSQFLADRYVTGTCPNCNHDNAYGDQCEKCGSSLSPKDLINPKSTLSGKTPVLKETTHWYLPMGDHEEWLREWIGTGKLEGVQHHDPKTWKNQVTGQCMSWIDGTLGDRAITRDLDWGVKVPVEGADGKVLYVWLDAPIGYISATKQWAEDNGKDWKDYWQNEETNLVHFIGKDNIVFHCIIFPIILKSMGNYNLPVNVPANEFLNLEGDKLSTSRNWAVWLHEYMEDFPGKQDELRYVLTAISPENRDSEFTWKDYQARVNNELVAILGNFVNRSVVLTHKYFDGLVPEPGTLDPGDEEVLDQISAIAKATETALTQFRFREAQAEAMKLARLGNKYLADTEPWKLIKTDEQRVKTILYVANQLCAALSIILHPFLPHTCEKLRGMLRFVQGAWDGLEEHKFLSAGDELNKAELLFKKIEDKDIAPQLQKLEDNKKAALEAAKTPEPAKSETTYDDFIKMDLRVGTILEAEKVKKSKKLLQLKVDTGIDQRTVVSGIGLSYQPEDIIGQQVTVLVNLAPRKIMGVESNGMILMAGEADDQLAFVQPDQAIKDGTTIS